MNASEIRDIEERLTGSFTLPMSQESLEDLVRHAKHQRALYIGELLAAIPSRMARFADGIRVIAASCTAARMRHI